jgi:hypothetical protein
MIKERERVKWNLKPTDLIPIRITLDCRWSSRGFAAEEATITIIDNETGKVMWVLHVLKKRKFGRNVFRVYQGSSKGMEGWGVLKLIEKIKEEGFTIERFAHDNDSSTKNHILSAFPKALEDLCISHAAKSFRDNIKKASKTHKELRGLGAKAFQWFYTAVSMTRNNFPGQELSEAAIKNLQERIIHFSKHVQGKHVVGICVHEDKKQSSKTITNPGALKKLDEICEVFAARADRYVSGSNSNRVEAYNSSIGKQVPKQYDFPRSYEAHANMALLRACSEMEVEQEVMTALGHRDFPSVTKALASFQKTRDWEKRRRMKPNFKKNKNSNKKLKRERNQKSKIETSEQISYKGKSTKCNCKKSKCKTKVCGCVKSDEKCGTECGCVNCENQESETVTTSSTSDMKETKMEIVEKETKTLFEDSTESESEPESETEYVGSGEETNHIDVASQRRISHAKNLIQNSKKLWNADVIDDWLSLLNGCLYLHCSWTQYKTIPHHLTKRIDTWNRTSGSLMFIPVHSTGSPGHWSMGCGVHLLNGVKFLVHYDSLSIHSFSKKIQILTNDSLLLDLQSTPILKSESQPQQFDSYSCGAFACSFAGLLFANRDSLLKLKSQADWQQFYLSQISKMPKKNTITQAKQFILNHLISSYSINSKK